MEVVVLDVLHACIGVSSDHRNRYTCFKTHGDVAMSEAIPSNALARMNIDFPKLVAVIFTQTPKSDSTKTLARLSFQMHSLNGCKVC